MKTDYFVDDETNETVKKVRKVKHRNPKQFGFPEDKWARGNGSLGYGRSYGHNSPSFRKRNYTETLNAAERL